MFGNQRPAVSDYQTEQKERAEREKKEAYARALFDVTMHAARTHAAERSERMGESVEIWSAESVKNAPVRTVFVDTTTGIFRTQVDRSEMRDWRKEN